MNNTLLLVLAGVVVFLIFRGEEGENTALALGTSPDFGGANGSPQSQAAAASAPGVATGGGTNSEQNIVHGLEGFGGAAVCTYYGLGAVAPVCAKAAPGAVKFGNATINAGNTLAVKSTGLFAAAGTRGATLAAAPAKKVATLADAAFTSTNALPVPARLAAQAAIIPIKVTADVGAKLATGAASATGALASGVKASTQAVATGVKKALSFL